MTLQKFRWSKVYESTEEELNDFLSVRDITATRNVAEDDQASGPRNLDEDMTLWCAEGSLILTLNNNDISMQPGDAIKIPAKTPFETVAGIFGSVTYESPKI